MREELRKVLDLIEQKTITAAQAAELLEAMGVDEDRPIPLRPDKKRLLKVDVLSADGDKVDIKVPVSLLRAGMGMGKNFAMSSSHDNEAMKQLDWDDLMTSVEQMIEDGDTGEIVTVNSANGDKVRIWLE